LTYYVYSVRTKKIYNKSSSKNVAIHVLITHNKTRGEFGFAMMDKETYDKNYGEAKVTEHYDRQDSNGNRQ